MTAKTITREQWLQHAIKALRPMFKAIDVNLPDEIDVSCGFPGGGSPTKRIGECWAAPAGQKPQIFISPVLVSGEAVLSTLLHEMVHASDNCASGHRGHFAKTAKALGFEGKMTSTPMGAELKAKISDLALALSNKHGAYPHRKITPSSKGTPKQWHRCECSECGFYVRINRKTYEEYGAPMCANPTHGFTSAQSLEDEGYYPANAHDRFLIENADEMDDDYEGGE